MLSRESWGAVALCGLLACSFDDSTGGAGEASSSTSTTTEGTTAGDTADPSGAEGTRDGSSGTPTSDTSSGDTTSGTGAPVGSGCCEAHAIPGCDEAAVQQCVCEVEQECCLFEWIESCAELAQARCEATCESDDSGSSGGGGSSDSGRVGCEEPVVIELAPADAVLSGNWTLGMSDLGEGEILRLQGGVQGEARFDVEVPCDDTWFVWVRYWEDGEDDSYFVTLDEAPEPPAIFEGDCTPAGSGYDWRLLNYRDPIDSSLCEYVEDPWTPTWDEGPHAIAFSFRESFALGRIVVTNDPRFAP